MDYDNVINNKLRKLRITNAEAARRISKEYNIELTEKDFILIKLGYYGGQKKRELVANYFGIKENRIPKKGKQSKKKAKNNGRKIRQTLKKD